MRRRLNLSRWATPICLIIVSFGGLSTSVAALGSQQNPQSGSLGLEATIPSPPPAQAATIALPGSGQSFTTLPVTVSGLCLSNLLIKILDNNIFVGAAECTNGSYNLKIDLLNGRNDLVAEDYDNLGQAGPISGVVTVNFSDSQYINSGSRVSLTSDYAELGANPGQELDWPIIISGGTPPYAISTDWGDGQAQTLQSSALAGKVTIKHTYNSAGTYQVTVTATDSNGTTAFLQVVGVANGQVVAATKSNSNNSTSSQPTASNSSSTPWWIFGIVLITLGPAFWLGSRHGRAVLVKKYK